MRLLDLFCCAGGAAVGYSRAGFEVWGVDINEQPRYPFPMHRGDAIDTLRLLMAGEEVKFVNAAATQFGFVDISLFDAIHASPPCQAHSDLQKQNKRYYEDFIPQVRALLIQSGLPYIIENVEGAPLRDPITLCGTRFPELRVIRHRLFESNVPLVAPLHGKHPLVFTHDKRKAHYGKLDQDTSFVQVTGGGNCSVANAKAAMGIDWMTKDELNEALPPAYTEYLGKQLAAAVERRVAA